MDKQTFEDLCKVFTWAFVGFFTIAFLVWITTTGVLWVILKAILSVALGLMAVMAVVGVWFIVRDFYNGFSDQLSGKKPKSADDVPYPEKAEG